MCHPRNDQLILRLIAEGRLQVDGSGRGTVYMRDLTRRDPVWREVGHEHRAQQAGKRPRAQHYRRFVVAVDGKVKTLRVNRVMWVAHHGPTHLEIDHVDDDALNCGIRNLHPLTRIENEMKKREGDWMRANGLGPEDDSTSDEPFVSSLDDDDIF